MFAGAWVLSCNAGPHHNARSALSQGALRCLTVQLAWLLGKAFGKDPMPFVCQVSELALQWQREMRSLTFKLPFGSVLLFLLLLYSLVGAHR